MAERFVRYNEASLALLRGTQDAATELNHDYNGTEHLLIALVRDGSAFANQPALDLPTVTNEVKRITGRYVTDGHEKGLTEPLKRIIELSVTIGVSAEGPDYSVEPRHFLDAMKQHHHNNGARILERVQGRLA